jgi:hypothetical protein
LRFFGKSIPLGLGNGGIGARSAMATPLSKLSDTPKAKTRERVALINDRFIQISLNVLVLFIVV